jgi:hypothetical protein
MELRAELSSRTSRRSNLRALHHGDPSLLTGARAISLQLAAASYIYIHYALKKKRKERRWWQTQLYTSREVYSGTSLLTEFSVCQWVV